MTTTLINTLTSLDINGATVLNGEVISGDDCMTIENAGINVHCVCIHCSAKIVSGEDTTLRAGAHRVAIDLNTGTLESVSQLIANALGREITTQAAHGVWSGGYCASLVCIIDADEIATLQSALLATHSGFGCFAILEEIA